MIPFLAFALGLLSGPALGILTWSDATAVAPLLALCCGVAGAGMAARLDHRALAVPALATGVIGAGAVAVALGALLRLPHMSAVALGGTASIVVALAGIAVTPRSLLAPALLAAAVALSPLRRPPFGVGIWVALLVIAPAVTALVFRALTARPPVVLPPAATLAALVLGGGLGSATGVSPLLVCWGAALALGAASPGRSVLRTMILDVERPAVGFLWFVAGVVASLPSWRLLAVAATFCLIPLLLEAAARRVQIPMVRPPEPVALALAWAFGLLDARGLDAAAPFVTVVALALLGVQASPALPPFVERLTRRRGPVEVSA